MYAQIICPGYGKAKTDEVLCTLQNPCPHIPQQGDMIVLPLSEPEHGPFKVDYVSWVLRDRHGLSCAHVYVSEAQPLKKEKAKDK